MVPESPSRAVASSTSGLGQIARHTPRLQPPDELGGGRNPHVGGDQRLLEPLPGLLVARVEGRFGDLVGERPPALAQRVA